MAFQSKLFFLGFSGLFLIAAFITMPHIGGTGLRLPYNISIWAYTPIFILLAIYLILTKKKIILPKGWGYLIVIFLLFFLPSLITNIAPVSWLFRFGTVLGGGLFLFALFQFELKQRTVDIALSILFFAIALHCLVGVLQVHLPGYLPGYFPPALPSKPSPYGILQQVNVQASYMSTGIIIFVYLLSRPTFRYNYISYNLILTGLACLMTYVLFATGSRMGLLGWAVGLLIVLFARKQYLNKAKYYLAVFFVGTILSGFLAQDGLFRSYDKSANLAEGEYKDSRLSMYKIAGELIIQKPLLGHGIGSFRRVWIAQSASFQQRHPEAKVVTAVNTSHPHNEFLYWLIEGGMISLLALVIIVVGLLRSLLKCGWPRGLAYAAILAPISLHTQVELPFYVSSIHWLTWLFLVFIVLRHDTKAYKVKLSTYAIKLIAISSTALAILVSMFMLHTHKAQTDVFKYLYKQSEPPFLQIAMNNLYFKPLAVELAMRAKLYVGLDDKNDDYIEAFTDWAEKENYDKKLLVYLDLVEAYRYKNYESVSCSQLEEAILFYPKDETIVDALKVCHATLSSSPVELPGQGSE